MTHLPAIVLCNVIRNYTVHENNELSIARIDMKFKS